MNFKPLLIVFLVLYLAKPCVVYAQSWSLGISGGGVISYLYAQQPHTDAQFKMGLFGGLSSICTISERFSAEGGLYYMQRGFRHDALVSIDYQTPQNHSLSHRFDYLTLPITANLAFGNKKQYFGSLGVFAAYLLKSQIISQRDLSANTPGFKTNFENTIQPYDAGVVVGGGWMIPLNTTMDLQLACKYYLSVLDATETSYLNWKSFKQQALTLNCTLYFHKQKNKK